MIDITPAARALFQVSISFWDKDLEATPLPGRPPTPVPTPAPRHYTCLDHAGGDQGILCTYRHLVKTAIGTRQSVMHFTPIAGYRTVSFAAAIIIAPDGDFSHTNSLVR